MAGTKARKKKVSEPRLGDAVWKDGYQPKADAKAVGQVLMRLAHQHGGDVEGLSKSAIVDAARHPDSPLHSLFTWDDTEAAEKCRLMEAGHLIRHIRIIKEGPTGEPEKTIAFVSLKVEGERMYVPTSKALSDDAMRARTLRDARSLLDSAAERLRQLGMFKAEAKVQAIADELDEGE